MDIPTARFHGEAYATVSWRAEDVQTLKPEWSLDKCEEALASIERHLRDRSIEVGWEIMEVLLDD